MGRGPSLQCPNQCSLPQVLRLSHFRWIQMPYSWFWRNYVVTHIGRDRAWWWANGQKWPLLGLPVGSLAFPCTTHPPTSTWVGPLATLRKGKKVRQNSSQWLKMTSAGLKLDFKFGIAFNRRNKGNDRNSPLNIGRNQFEAGAPALRTFCTIDTDGRKVVSLIQVI